jgi:DMSO/TMAO reductase YedYZ molybdopterin-dependent catalytic subunit
MRRGGWTFLLGAGLGLVAFGGFGTEGFSFGLPLWTRAISGVRIPVEFVGERLFRALPPVWFGLLVNAFEGFGRRVLGIEHFGKILALLVANLLVAGLGGLGALVLERWVRRQRSALVAAAWATAATWIAWSLVLMPLAGGGILGQNAGPVGRVLGLLLVWSAAYGVPLVAVLRLTPQPATGEHPPGEVEGIDRREAIARGLRVVLGAMAGSALGELALRTAAWAQSVVSRIRGLPPEITPNDQFYTVSKNFFDPQVDGRTWRLEVTGLVEKSLTLTLDDLKRLPAFSRPHTFECISNPVGGDLIGNAVWKGVRFRDLFARAQPKPQAHKVVFWCADGYHTAVPLVDLMDPDAFLAYEMNGSPLPHRHGFPLRAVIPGLFGMKNPKWITKIELTDKDHLGYWESQGWSDEAVVKTMSKFTTPQDGATLPAGTVGVGGVAYAGDRGISAVEVSFDDGKTWRRAEVKPAMGKHTWVLWGLFWEARPGRYVLKVRALDGVGTLQDPRPRPPLPEGATGYHTIRVTVR